MFLVLIKSATSPSNFPNTVIDPLSTPVVVKGGDSKQSQAIPVTLVLDFHSPVDPEFVVGCQASTKRRRIKTDRVVYLL